YSDAGLNTANFDRSIPRTGRVIIPSDPKALTLVAPATLLAVNACPGAAINGIPCTPFVTAAQAGLPEGLRKNYYKQFLPRLGFSSRPTNKTTLRGIFGVYERTLLGSVFFPLTAPGKSDVRFSNNVGAAANPFFVLPETRPPASGIRSASVG